MGEVYRGWDHQLRRVVAVKIIKRALLDDAGARQHFLDEARSAASFTHQNSIIVHDSGEDSAGNGFIVMEYVDGHDLRYALRDSPDGMPEPRVVHIGLQVLDALESTMTEHRIRHVPVVIDGQLAAIVSIGDVVKNRIHTLQAERDQLSAYISS